MPLLGVFSDAVIISGIGYHQRCSGEWRRRNCGPTSFSRFVLKWLESCFNMDLFCMRSHTVSESTTSLDTTMHA